MKHVPITQKAKTRFTFKDNMDISMNADGTGGAFKSPNKNLEKVAEQLEGAVKAHGEQAKAVRKHIAEMKDMKSPAKKKVHPKVQKSLDEGAKKYDTRKYLGHKSKKSPAKEYVSDAQRKAVHASKADGGKGNPNSPAKRKDACYSKVKSRYKKWPSAYASGALAKCRKVGAANWGNKSK